MQLQKITSLVATVAALSGAACGKGDADVETRAREALITGKPPRIEPLRTEEFTDEMRETIRSMARLTPTPDSDDEALSGNTESADPGVTEMLATMIRHPELYGYHLDLARVLFQGALPPRDRELAILRVGWLLQAPYEWGEHVWIGKENGLSAEEIERVTRGSSAEGWSERDRAIVRSVEELIGDAMISDGAWDVLASEFDEKQLIELVMLVGQYQTVAYYQNSLRLRPREGNEGLSSR